MQNKHSLAGQPPKTSAEAHRLRTDIEKIRCRLDSVASHFEQETDPMMIDCCIYELKAAQLRYQFLLRRFKNLENPAQPKT